MSDDQPKSAFDLAMERLRKRDAERGISEPPTPPSDAQKAAIAEARNVRAAKVAELQILHRSKLATVLDPAERAQLEDDYRRDLQRLADECDRKIEKIRQS